MGIEQIFIFTFGTFTALILFCACKNYCKKRVREIREKNKNKKLQHILKRNNTVKPITETDENIDEETKDEIKNEIRLPQLITNEDNV
jgi:pyruvate/oxaloacetate carboxyltransferase